VELLGLRELMINFDYQRIREYEALWRRHHGIADGAPSTLYDPALERGAAAAGVAVA
jgi:hypothetical protein